MEDSSDNRKSIVEDTNGWKRLNGEYVPKPFQIKEQKLSDAYSLNLTISEPKTCNEYGVSFVRYHYYI